jgi:hypothetical protein
VFRHRLHSICRRGCLAAMLVLLVSASGCARWKLEDFSLNRLRDDRAVDIDHRLEGTKPIVVNPF